MLKPVLLSAAIILLPMSAVSHAQDMSKMMMMKSGAQMSEADKGYMVAMQGMMDAMMKTEMTGDANGDFVRMMIPHHQSAVEMAEVLLKQQNVDPQLKAMAEKMRDDQTKEIAELKTWLDAHPR